MLDVVFATKNIGKLKEIKAVLYEDIFNVVSMSEAGIELDIVEDGETFEDNAVKKAVEIMKICGKVTLADDSGIEIDFLGGKPGVYSARYMGENTGYDIKNKKILEMLDGVPEDKRTARFVCVIAAAFPNGKIINKRAVIDGIIGYEIKGENGFGYDPIFFVPEYGITTAEMPAELKNKISHRGKALNLIKPVLTEYARYL